MEATRTDIRQSVMEQLASDSRVDAEEIDVEVTDGHVILRGMVPSYRAKWAAAEAAQRVWGVLGVDNELEVRVSTPTSDDEIAGNIRNALMRDADLDSSHTNIDVHDGRVRLFGTVPTGWAKIRAEEHARWTRGVTGVTNELAVVPTGNKEDRELAVEIERALQRDSAVDAAGITVAVSERHATLSGVVSNWAERSAALEDALHVPGVSDVRDELTVRYR